MEKLRRTALCKIKIFMKLLEEHAKVNFDFSSVTDTNVMFVSWNLSTHSAFALGSVRTKKLLSLF
jgi:hypothetical protein